MHPPVGGSTIAGAFRWRTNSRLREYNSGGDSRGTRTVDGTRKTQAGQRVIVRLEPSH
jgi:hypothetical protein